MATRYDVKSKWSPPFFLAINELFSQFQCKVTKAANLLACLACPRITVLTDLIIFVKVL